MMMIDVGMEETENVVGIEIKSEAEEEKDESLPSGVPLDDQNNGDDDCQQCLICAVRISKKLSIKENFTILPGSEGNFQVSQQLWSIFILKTLLNYPEVKIIQLMKKTFGLFISDWFVLCPACTTVAQNAMEVYRKLLECQNAFTKFQNAIKDKVVTSLQLQQHGQKSDSRQRRDKVKAIEIGAEIRNHFRNKQIRTERNLKKQSSRNGVKFASKNGDCHSPIDNLQLLNCPEKNHNWDDELNVASRTFAATEAFKVKDEMEQDTNLWSVENDGKQDYSSDGEVVTTAATLLDTPSPDHAQSTSKGLKCPNRKESLVPVIHKKRKQNEKVDGGGGSGETSQVSRNLRRNKKSKVHNDYNELLDDSTEHRSLENGDVAEQLASQTATTIKPKYKRKRNQQQPSKARRKVVEFNKEDYLFCEICPFKIKKTRTEQFDYHMKRHQYFENCEVIDGKLKCKVCGELVSGIRELHGHTRQNHASELGIPVAKCHICNKLYPRQFDVDKHIAEVHTKQCKFFCDVCGYGTMTKNAFDRHMQLHGSERAYVCQLCAATFKNDSILRTHLNKVHSSSRDQDKGLCCKYCENSEERTFSNKSLLRRHMEDKHKDLYVHKCDQCDNVYLSVASLQLHKKVNHGGEQAECQFCKAKVLNRVYLYNHYQNVCKKKPPGFKYTYTPTSHENNRQ